MTQQTAAAVAPAQPAAPAPRAWQPLGQRVMVKPLTEHKREGDVLVTAAGIAMPSTASKPSITGVVLAVGPGCRFVGPGDMVMFVSYQGATVKVGGSEFNVLDEDDLLCVLPRDGGQPAPQAPRGKPTRAEFARTIPQHGRRASR